MILYNPIPYFFSHSSFLLSRTAPSLPPTYLYLPMSTYQSLPTYHCCLRKSSFLGMSTYQHQPIPIHLILYIIGADPGAGIAIYFEFKSCWFLFLDVQAILQTLHDDDQLVQVRPCHNFNFFTGLFFFLNQNGQN